MRLRRHSPAGTTNTPGPERDPEPDVWSIDPAERATSTKRRHGWVVAPLAAITVTTLVPLVALFMVVWLSGWRMQVVLTGSMVPTYPKGTLLISAPTKPADVRPGDPLMFEAPWRNHTLVTHRVQRIIKTGDGIRFVTRGDAYDSDDPSPIPPSLVRAIVKWDVQKLGTVMWGLRGYRSTLYLVAFPTLLWVVLDLRVRRRRRRGVCATCGRSGHRGHGTPPGPGGDVDLWSALILASELPGPSGALAS